MISKDKKVLVKKLYENGSQYNTLKPSYKTDGTYLYIQRQAGVSFTISPIGTFAGDLLEWTAVSSYPETDADVTVI